MNFYELEQLYASGADREKIFGAMEEMGLSAVEENNISQQSMPMPLR